MVKERFCLVGVSLLVVVLGVSVGTACGAPQRTYDGHWWFSASTDEQDGFLNGFADCYFNDYNYKGPEKPWMNVPTSLDQKALDDFYMKHPAERGLPVPDALGRLRALPSVKHPPDGEHYPGRHGFYDGLYWMQEYALGGLAEQRGFVEGYLWCWKNCLRDKGATFSKSPDEYVSLITKWYQFDPKTGDVNAKRQPAKIADVLYKFRDRNKAPSQPRR